MEKKKAKFWIENEIIDYLGNIIHIDDRALRVHSYSNSKEFKRVTVVKIDLYKKYTPIGIVTDGNTKIGWTYPDRIIVQSAFKKDI